MNKSFGQQQQTDEMTSMATFKDLMQQMHKTNAQLETERIDLQVKSSKLKEELEQVRIEKENLNRKYLNSDQINQRLQNERIEIDLNFKRNIDLKQNEISHLNNELNSQREENERLRNENEMLIQSLTEYEQLKLNHDQLTQHYEQLYNQASEIVTGNQVLSEQTQAQTLEIHQLNQLIEDYQLKIDHLEHCNSELNTQKINLDMKLVSIENKLAECECDLRELNILRNSKLDVDKLTQLNKDLKLELTEKNELIEQLNQAKDFLAENNSNLLTNNIRIQLFVESMGLELTSLETSSAVNEYDSLRIECKQIQFQLNEMKTLNQQLEINQQNYKDLINNKELEIKNLISQINSKEDKVDASEQTDENDLVIKKELEQARLEMDQFKLKYEETIEKQANLEQLNLKLKAKVKQLLKQPVVATTTTTTTTINVSTNTDELTKMCSESIQTDEILLNSENLIEFGSKIVANDLNNYVSQRVDDLKNDMTIFLLNNEVKVQNALREALKYKNLLNNLEKENEKFKFDINELKKNEIQTFNIKNNNLSPLDLSDNHQDELDRINQLHSEQLAQFESNFTNIQNENEKLKFDINELKQKEIQLLAQINTFKTKYDNLNTIDSSKQHQDELDRINQLHSEQLAQFESNFTNLQNENDLLMSKLEELEKESTNTQSNELESFKSKYEEINQKNLNLEQLNLKYKAKLKQLLKQQQQQQTNTSSLLVEQRSTNSTPTLSPNPVHSYEQHQCTTETISTQTDLLNIDLLEDLLKTYKSELAVLNSQLEESNLEIENLNKKIEDLNKIETTTHVKMASDQDLQARLESVQQLNLKLKAKLKQQIEKNKTGLDESLVSSTSSSSSSELNNLKQAKLELERILQEKSIQNEKLANDIQNLNQENEMLLNLKLMKIQELEILNQDLNLKNDKLKIDLLILNNEKSKTDQLNFELESNISELKESKTMIHDLEGKNNDLLVRINEKSNEIDQFNAKIQEYHFKIDQLNFELEFNTAKNKQNEIIIQDLEGKNNDLLVFTNEKSDEIDQLNLKIQELELLKQDLTLKCEQLSNENSKIDQLNSELEKNIQDLEAKNNQLNISNEYQSKIGQLNSELESNIEKVKQNEITIQELEARNNQLNNDLLVFSNEKSDEIDKFNLKIQELEKLNQDLNVNFEKQSDDLLILNGEKSRNDSELEHKINKLKESESRIQDLEAKNNQLNNDLLLFSNNNSNEYQFKIDKLNSELESNIAKVKQSELTIQDLEDKNNVLLVCVNEKSDEIDQFITKINQYEAIINDKLFKIQELESLNHNNCLKIKELEHLNQTYQINIDQLNAEFQFKSNEISSKLLESQEIANNHQKSIDLLLKEKHVLLEENQNSLNTNSLKIKELEHLIQDYQLRIDHLNTELNDLKEEKRKNQFIIDGLNEQLNEFKKIEIVEMTKEKNLLDLKLKLNENDLLEQSFSNGNSPSMNNSMYSTTSVKSSIQFETQLKHCHEKCETVVEKLNLLKKQNEALNSKIKSFKAKDLNN
jgi:chromosome segregation ATPase